MNKILSALLFTALLTSACTNKGQKNNNSTQEVLSEVTDKNSTVIIPESSGIVNLHLADGVGFAQIQKKENQTVYIKFTSEEYTKINAHLSSSDSLANIRFSQIFLPDGSMDGPFGRDIEYPLPQNGVYKISIHENTMAGDPWCGLFNIEVKLTK